MHRIAFKMQLFPGYEAEYRKRHDELWPELKQLLKESGISNYSLFLDERTNGLFAILHAEDPPKLDALPATPVMQKWWKHMAEVMAANPDNSPVPVEIKVVFYL